jgi:K(+)-stimulated pyrophosphate-energized sodium pump
MLCILLFIPGDYAGPCFIGFAIGESLGAAALRIAGGIFTKIADIGSDMMKIVFRIKEDDARNPGVIADCTGDNAGDSIGPSADGFETYGVTGVALITFILLAVADARVQVSLLVWIFVMRVMMIVASGASYMLNEAVAKARYADTDEMNFEAPLTQLVWLTSIVSVALTYVDGVLAHAATSPSTNLPLDRIAADLGYLGYKNSDGSPVQGYQLRHYDNAALTVLTNVDQPPAGRRERGRISPVAATLAHAALLQHTR